MKLFPNPKKGYDPNCRRFLVCSILVFIPFRKIQGFWKGMGRGAQDARGALQTNI